MLWWSYPYIKEVQSIQEEHPNVVLRYEHGVTACWGGGGPWASSVPVVYKNVVHLYQFGTC